MNIRSRNGHGAAALLEGARRGGAIAACAAVLLAGRAVLLAQPPELAAVVSRPSSRTIELPGEIQPFLTVALRARVSGYVERVLVDRGSVVKRGQLLVELNAPEMAARIAQAESKQQGAEADRVQAQAQLEAATATFERTRQAAQTDGAVSGNELTQAEKQVEAAKALLSAREQASRAAAADVRAERDLQAYLRLSAPFDGVVTDRLVHPGALVAPNDAAPLLVVQQVSHLRVVVAVPEQQVAAIPRGASVAFTVPAYSGRVFNGTIARLAHALDEKTRSMSVELDAPNADGALAPGMYANVRWPVKGTTPSLFVPATSVVTTSERTFVVRSNGGKAEWVDVKKGPVDGELVEVTGALQPGDRVVRRATDEMRPGTKLGG